MTLCEPFQWLYPTSYGFADEEDKLDPVEEAVIAVARELDPPSSSAKNSVPKQFSFAPTEATSRVVIGAKQCCRVPFYAMVCLAFLNAADEYIDVQQIYAFVMHVFPRYRGTTGEGWRSALRHQLAKYSDSFVKYKMGRRMRYQLVKDETTSLRRKFDVFCSKVDSMILDLAEDCPWEEVKTGKIGIPEVLPKTPAKKERTLTKKEEQKEILRLQKESQLAVVNILKDHDLVEETAVKTEYTPVDWEIQPAPIWNYGDDFTAAWEQYQQQIYTQNYFYYNPMTFDGNMYYW